MSEYKPGQKVPISGIYGVYRGRRKINEVTCVKGEPFPATPEKGSVFRLIRATHHG